MVQFKNRYLVMEVILDPNRETGASDSIELTEFNVRKAIEYSIQLNFGECGLASSHSSFQVKYLNKLTKICIIRVSRDDHQKIWAAITMVRTIGKCPVLFNLLDLSGCIRVCRRKALECEETKIKQHKLMLGGHVTPEFEKSVKNNLGKIKALES
ncbi:putative ribonuclease P/MRP protein subunit POP5 [Carex rostrata]